MDKNRIIKFLDSLEERGIMAPGQQSVVLQTKEDDVVAGSNLGACKNSSYETCGGSDNFNDKCINYGVACAKSLNDGCTNKPASVLDTNKLTEGCNTGG